MVLNKLYYLKIFKPSKFLTQISSRQVSPLLTLLKYFRLFPHSNSSFEV